MKYAYMRGGAPILRWGQTAPLRSRAAETAGLGSLGGTTLDDPTLVLPRPGAPEPIGVSQLAGCSCSGRCGCGGMSGFFDDPKTAQVMKWGAIAAGAYWLFKRMRRRGTVVI